MTTEELLDDTPVLYIAHTTLAQQLLASLAARGDQMTVTVRVGDDPVDQSAVLAQLVRSAIVDQPVVVVDNSATETKEESMLREMLMFGGRRAVTEFLSNIRGLREIPPHSLMNLHPVRVHKAQAQQTGRSQLKRGRRCR